MTVHENVILDLLPAVRSGHASAESRALVEEFLQANPKLATYAALMPSPDPQLELRTLARTRREVGRHGWNKGLAIAFTLLPFSFVIDQAQGFRFLFADYPGLIVGMAVCAAAFWMRDFLYNKRWSAPK
jgi:hypothetical protein